MNTIETCSKEGLKWRCSKHRNYPGDIICLDGDAIDRIMCFMCLNSNSIPTSNLIPMGCVLAANEYDVLNNYPPLKDQELSEKLRHAI